MLCRNTTGNILAICWSCD